ncbi:hypothetical protein Pla175_17590 [Pirellulimonas nuda]|uniref:Uncharacterized protein n=1 Tax=Pirellulimonas nuda TaxID=2528009 RepID=A0A518DAA5_9BACT|nr:hypothetical protein [Pirellulimonas nuda]QDU88383.1 hypothetical protein Pla175_17590 [Pirellulimonas nuda]
MNEYDYNPSDDQDHEPLGVEDVINERRRFNADVLRAVKAFRRAKPFRGTIDEQKAALKAMHAVIVEAYSLNVELEFGTGFGEDEPSLDSVLQDRRFLTRRGRTVPISAVAPDFAIRLQGRLSLVSYLHLVGAARGLSPADRCEFSLNLFKRVFPKSFERAEKDGMVLRRPRRD